MKVSARGLNLNFQTEVPTGTVNGANATFTLTQTPYPSSLIAFINGLIQLPTAFSFSGTTLTFTAAPPIGSDLLAYYVRNT